MLQQTKKAALRGYRPPGDARREPGPGSIREAGDAIGAGGPNKVRGRGEGGFPSPATTWTPSTAEEVRGS